MWGFHLTRFLPTFYRIWWRDRHDVTKRLHWQHHWQHLLAVQRLPVRGLQVVWVLVVLWYELWTFFYHVQQCQWPDTDQTYSLSSPAHNGTTATRILIIADPQILDHRSYPGRPPIFTFLTQLFVDLNLRKSWRATIWTRPDAVVFLGDMMDGGRLVMSDSEYETYYRRFKSIFKIYASTPVYYLPGNHDVGLGVSSLFSEHARERYKAHFGPLNHKISVANHTIIFLDAQSLVEEDYQRRGLKLDFDHWEPVSGGTVEFVKALTPGSQTSPVVLFSHIPLSRPDGTSCGVQRERGTITANLGFGYQNTLGPATTDFLLQKIKPSIVFSGDDHDYCEYTHHVSSDDGVSIAVREVTVKSLSMAMGIKRPGFQLLSLTSPTISQPTPQMPSDKLCLLPDQLSIYLSIYIPLLALSLLALLLSNIYRTRYVHRRHTRLLTSTDDTVLVSSAPPVGRDVRLRLDLESNVQEQWTHLYDTDEDNRSSNSLPTPVTAALHSSRIPPRLIPTSWSFVLFGKRRRFRIPYSCSVIMRNIVAWLPVRWTKSVPRRPHRHRGLVGGFLGDIRDVAGFPLVLFALITCWMFVDG